MSSPVRVWSASALVVAVAACGVDRSGFDAGPDVAADVLDDMASHDVASDVPHRDAARDVPIDVPPLVCNPSTGDGGTDPAGTYTFVVSSLTIDDTASADTPHTGFNVDGIFSTATDTTGCRHADFFSRFDPDQDSPSGCVMGTPGCSGGVDNQMPSLADLVDTALGAGFSTRAELESDVDDSLIVYLVQLLDVDSLTDDPAVRVRIYAGYPTFTTGCTSVAADREYQVARNSLIQGGTSLDDAAFAVNGRIVAGRLVVDGTMDSPAVLPITLPAFSSGSSPTIPLHGVHLRVNLTAAGGTSGNLGGAALGDDLLAAFQMAAPSKRSLIAPIVGQAVDVQIGGVCSDLTQVPPRFGAIGVGLGMQMVRATIRMGCPVADRPMPGACGAQ